MNVLERAIKLRRTECLTEYEEHETDGVKIVKTKNSIKYTFKDNQDGRFAYEMFKQLCKQVR